MARKPNKPAEPIQETPLPEADLAHTQNVAAVINAMSDDRDLVNQLLGQAQMADAFGKFSQTVWSSKLAYVKENKLYRALAGKKNPNGLELLGTWEEFCAMLGVSDEKANQDIANLRAFGEEALDSMSRMGIGYRELRQYRRLPDDAKQALIEVAKSGDAVAFEDFAESLIERHEKEKAEAAQKVEEATADLEATRQILADEKTAHSQTKVDLQKARRRIKTLSADEATKELREEISSIAYEAEVAVSGNLRAAFEELATEFGESGIDHRQFMASLVRNLETELHKLRREFALPEDDGIDDLDLDAVEM